MILYLLQHCPYFIVLVKTYFAGSFPQYFNTLVGFIHVLNQRRQLSIRDTLAYCHAIALSHYQNKKRNTCVN